jgi:hypothetical protein
LIDDTLCKKCDTLQTDLSNCSRCKQTKNKKNICLKCKEDDYNVNDDGICVKDDVQIANCSKVKDGKCSKCKNMRVPSKSGDDCIEPIDCSSVPNSDVCDDDASSGSRHLTSHESALVIRSCKAG